MRVHPASQIESSKHPKAVLDLTKLRVNRSLIGHIVRETIDTINQAVGSSSTSRSRRNASRSSEDANFAEFAVTVIGRADVPMSVLLVSLIYIHRSRPHLSVEAEEWALHRVFLGALIVASKFTNDSTLKNVHWAIATGIFGKRDIGRIEREFLEVLDWDLTVSESEIVDLHPTIIALYPPTLAQNDSTSSPSPSHCLTFTLDSISYDSDDSSSSASSPRTPCDPEKATPFVESDPSEPHDSHHTRQSSHSESQVSRYQELIAAFASEYCPVVAA